MPGSRLNFLWRLHGEQEGPYKILKAIAMKASSIVIDNVCLKLETEGKQWMCGATVGTLVALFIYVMLVT